MSQTVEQQQVETASVRDGESSDKKQKSRRPPNTAFRQQRLKAWQPILTPKTVLPLFFAVGAIFAPIGGLLIYASSQVQEISIDYSDCNTTAPACPQYETIPSGKTSSYFKTSPDNIPKPTWCRDTTEVGYGVDNFLTVTTPTCHLQFNIPENLEAPVLLYYRLTNFYQNHRRYVKSFDQDQLKGNARDAGAINGSDCDPLEGAKDPIDGIFKPYYPCGLIANSLFNDTISEPVLLNPSGTSMDNMTYPMTTNGTAWSSDGDLYHATNYSLGAALPPPNWRVRYPTYNESFPYPSLHTDDHFQVWMRTAGLPTFSKLYRRNDDQTMEAGNYEITIYDNFPVNIYDGTKTLLISTRTVMGGKNPFLGIAYVVVGGLCLVLGAVFTLTQLIRPRKLGDHGYLSWNTEESSTATTTGRAPRPTEGA